MKILFMADVPPDPNAGAAGTEVQTACALRALGHEVDERWSPDLGRRIRHGNLHYLLELPAAYRRAMRDALRQKHYDVVHVNQPHGYLAAKAKPEGTVFVHRSHGFELRVERELAPWRARYGEKTRLLSRIMASLLARHSALIARHADGHIVSSHGDGDFLVRELSVERARVAVIPQAAPDSFLNAAAPPMSADRLRRVLYVGQFAFVKAPMIVAEAMRLLAGRSDLQFTWVCSGAHHAGIRQLLRGVSVELLDWMPAESLRDVYDRHGVFLFPSFFEGFGKAFLEAMSRGLCVIATNVGGARDVIVPGENGLLVPPGDAAALADAAGSLDLPRACAMSEEAARTARKYTWARVARETAAFYERLRELAR